MRVLVDQTVRYLDTNAKEAKAMMSTLEKAETEGFTKGINYPARETLLAGWRKQLTGLGKNLPGAKKDEGANKKTAKNARR